jgi:tetratricopeptide (TPR) repeat protein
MISIILSAALALQAAAPIEPLAIPVDAPPPPPGQLLAMPPELHDMLQRQVIEPTKSQSRSARLDRLVHFVFDADGLGMQYDYDANYTVADAFRTRRANCLTFTLLTVALARDAGFTAYGQELDHVLTWEMDDDIVVQNTHANAGVIVGGTRYTLDVAADEVLTTSPPQRVDDARLLSLFYDNRAMELLIRGQTAAAGTWLRAALQADDGYASAWNNAGVLAQRNGDARAAESDLLRALQLEPRHTGALFNLIGLYRRTGDVARADAWQRRASKTLRHDPFQQFALGLQSEHKGDYPTAAKYYRRAVLLDRNQHLFHFSLARAYLHMGQTLRADWEMQQAHDLSNGTNRDRYQAKLDRLKQMLLR